MTNVHQNSKSGDTPVQIRKAPSLNLSDITSPPVNIEQHTQRLYEDYHNLPAVCESKVSEVINWLGSSYSGTDIKVVAHMYDAASFEGEIKRSREQKELADALVKGCTGLLGALTTFAEPSFLSLTFDEKRQAFEDATVLNKTHDIEKRALQFLVSNVFAGSNFTFLGLAKMRRKLENIKQANDSLSRELGDQLKDLSTIDASSARTITLASLQTLSIQTHREKHGVRACGHSYIKGMTRGPRTIAGSMIFTMFNEHALAALIRAMGTRETIWRNSEEIATLLPDQLPPLDLTIAFANEYGSLSEMRIYGVEFLNDGVTFSIEDLLSENIINFMARDCDVITKVGKVRLSRLQRGMLDIEGKDDTASSLLFNNQRYYEYLDRLSVRRRLLNR